MKTVFSLLLACLAITTGLAAPEQPNIIVIFTDDHGWPDIGAAGVYDNLKTPHIDALAASGVRATNGYVTAPQCVPSRAGLLSGRSQNRFGVESNGESLDGFNAQTTIAEWLKKAGYATGQIGKWHLGPTDRITDHGFDDVYAKNANRSCHANYTLDGETIDMQIVDDDLYHLDACSEAALSFIRRHEDQPFFLYLAYRAPHVPLDAPEKYLSRFPGEMPERRRQALAMISAMDDGVGAIVSELKQRGLTEKTLIFFIGDNGAPLKIHKLDAPGGGPGWDGSLNEPLNGEKGMLSEGGIRVPWLVSWPGTLPAGTVYDHPVSSLDVAATAVSLAGIRLKGNAFDGTDLVPYLTGKTDGVPHDFLAWRWIAQSAIREGKWKLLRGGEREYLFDLEADPSEKNDLLSEHPEIANRLRNRLETWAGELQPPGLTTKPMASTWETYFDHYLEGKPAPQPGEGDRKTQSPWVIRNGKGEVREDTLVVIPEDGAGKRRPFVAVSGFSRPSPLILSAEIRNPNGGEAGFAWRFEPQKDFPRDQSATVSLKATDEWQTIETEVEEAGSVVHLRVQLPSGSETKIRSVEVRSTRARIAPWRLEFSDKDAQP